MNADLALLRDEEADSEDGPISETALTIADQLLSQCPDSPPSLCPNTDNGISMEWMKGKRTMRVSVRGRANHSIRSPSSKPLAL